MESQAHATVKKCGNAQQDKRVTNGECGRFEQGWTEAKLTHADLGLETVHCLGMTARPESRAASKPKRDERSYANVDYPTNP